MHHRLCAADSGADAHGISTVGVEMRRCRMAMATATLYHRVGTVNIVQVQSASDGQTVLDMATISSPYQGSTATAAGNHGICGSDDAPDLGVSYELAPGPCGKEGISPGRHPSIVLRQKQIIAEASRTPTPANQQSLCISCLTGFIRTVKEASN